MFSIKYFYKELFSKKNSVIIILILLIVIIYLSTFYILYQKSVLESEAKLNLTAIAESKISEINHWIDDHYVNTTAIYKSSVFGKHVYDFMIKKDDKKRDEIYQILNIERASGSYVRVSLIDNNGVILISSSRDSGKYVCGYLSSIKKVLSTGGDVFTGLYKCKDDGSLHISNYIPIYLAPSQRHHS